MGISKREARSRRHRRVRKKLRGTVERPRLCVFRSPNHIYAQIIDDSSGRTLAHASTLDTEIKADLDGKNKVARAAMVGNLIARRAQDGGVSQVVFDCGGFAYHGRVKSLADAARESGLRF